MQEVIRAVWPEGWTPNSDGKNGSPQGLLRADNLRWNKEGALTLCRGSKIVSSGPLSAQITQIYTQKFNLSTYGGSGYPSSAKVRYVHLLNGTILRNYGPTFKSLEDFETLVASGGDLLESAFVSMYGHVYMLTGLVKRKDNGLEQYDIGVPAPAAPSISVNAPPSVNCSALNAGTFSDWVAVESGGTFVDTSDYLQINANSSTLRGVAQVGSASTLTLDTTNFSGVSGRDTGDDMFKWNVRVSDTSVLISVRLEFLLDTPVFPATTTEDVLNYYWYEWNARESAPISLGGANVDNVGFEVSADEVNLANQDLESGIVYTPSFRLGINTWSLLQAKRGDFNRVGTDDSKNWTNVKGIRVSFNGVSSVEIVFNDLFFEGGVTSPLTGYYKWVQTSGRQTEYLTESLSGAESTEQELRSASVTITPAVPNAQANTVRIYRSGGTLPGYYLVKENQVQYVESASNAAAAVITKTAHGLTSGNTVFFSSGIANWAAVNGSRVVTVLSANTFSIPVNSSSFGALTGQLAYVNISPFTDTLSDIDAKTFNQPLNVFRDALPFDIVAALPINRRILYFTRSSCYPSLQDDPEIYDPRTSFTLSGSETEYVLFAAQVSEGVIMVGTTKDIIVISGKFSDLGNGLLDYSVTNLQVANPPVSKAFIVEDSSLIYLTANGWRARVGTSDQEISSGLANLYNGFECHGITPIEYSGTFSCTLRKGEFIISSPHTGDFGRSLQCFSFKNKVWRMEKLWDAGPNRPNANAPIVIYTEDDGTLLAGTEATGDLNLREYDTGTLIDEADPLPFRFLTVFDHLGTPNNRKDSFTLALEADFGASATVQLAVSGLTQTGTISTVSSSLVFAGPEIKTIDLSPLGLCKRYQVELYSTDGVTKADIKQFGFVVELRPTQTNFLRIPPTNWGTPSRKRIPEFPFLIDTLGNNVTFTPRVDAVAQPTSVVNTIDALPYSHLFTTDVAGYAIGGFLQATTGVFEYYDLIQPREVEILPDPVKYKRIPYSNLGTISRKQFVRYAIVIDTRGSNVTLTPIVDGVNQTPLVINTNRKQTVIYTFTSLTEGIDIGGVLEGANPFEFYGLDPAENVFEKLPARSKFLQIETNFGSPNKKRIRTLPFKLFSNGGTVTLAPFVDGVAYPTETFSSTEPRTMFYMFDTDVFGVDLRLEVSSPTDFEFYDLFSPAVVEILPIQKRLDQIGPMEFNRYGKLYSFSLWALCEGSVMNYRIYNNDVPISVGNFATTPGKEVRYRVQLPKYINFYTLRLELQAASPFHRLGFEIEVSESGNDTEKKRIKVGGNK